MTSSQAGVGLAVTSSAAKLDAFPSNDPDRQPEPPLRGMKVQRMAGKKAAAIRQRAAELHGAGKYDEREDAAAEPCGLCGAPRPSM